MLEMSFLKISVSTIKFREIIRLEIFIKCNTRECIKSLIISNRDLLKMFVSKSKNYTHTHTVCCAVINAPVSVSKLWEDWTASDVMYCPVLTSCKEG